MMFQLNPSARLRAVFVARRGDVAACRCAYRAGHDTPIITGDKLMNNKILSFLTALGLAAACLATSSAFAVGAYRVGGYVDDQGNDVRVTMFVARAVVSNDPDYTATEAGRDAADDCEDVRADRPIANGLDCLDIPSHNTNTDGVFRDQCLVIVAAPGVRENMDPSFAFDADDYGVGLGDNCVMAMTNAIANCSSNECDMGEEIVPLNGIVGTGDLYLIDGSATACPDGQYTAPDPNEALVCQDAGTSEDCRNNNPRLPILERRGVCRAAQARTDFDPAELGMGFRTDLLMMYGDGNGTCNEPVSRDWRIECRRHRRVCKQGLAIM